MVCLAWGMLVDWLEIHYPARGPVMLCCDDHPTGPGVMSVNRDRFNHSKSYITLNASLHIVDPVGWYLASRTYSSGLGLFINEQAQWG